MNVNFDIKPVEMLDLSKLNNITPTKTEKTDSFDDVMSAAMTVFDDTNKLQIAADQAQIDFASGKSDSMLAVTMAEQKAFSALSFTVQVTNKVVEAYREIMRIQL